MVLECDWHSWNGRSGIRTESDTPYARPAPFNWGRSAGTWSSENYGLAAFYKIYFHTIHSLNIFIDLYHRLHISTLSTLALSQSFPSYNLWSKAQCRYSTYMMSLFFLAFNNSEALSWAPSYKYSIYWVFRLLFMLHQSQILNECQYLASVCIEERVVKTQIWAEH